MHKGFDNWRGRGWRGGSLCRFFSRLWCGVFLRRGCGDWLRFNFVLGLARGDLHFVRNCFLLRRCFSFRRGFFFRYGLFSLFGFFFRFGGLLRCGLGCEFDGLDHFLFRCGLGGDCDGFGFGFCRRSLVWRCGFDGLNGSCRGRLCWFGVRWNF